MFVQIVIVCCLKCLKKCHLHWILVHETTVFCVKCPLSSLVGLRAKANFRHHRRSSATSGRWVSLPLPPSVGQRGRPRVAGGERNTTPRQRKGEGGGEAEREHEVSEWVEKEKVRAGEREEQRKNRVGFGRFFLSSLSLSEAPPLFWLSVRKEEDDDGDDEDVEEESTMRHRFNKRDEHLDPSHSVAPGPTDRRRHDSSQTSTCATQTRATGFRPRDSGWQLFASEESPALENKIPGRKSFYST